jgi:two-component system cell cycle sensor histidine kinase/response regulator CckA
MGKHDTTNKQLTDELERAQRRIVELEKAEAECKEMEEALKESAQLLQSIIQGSPIPTFVIGNDHKVIYWNKALEELSGISAAEVIGTNRHWRAFYTEERPCMADILVHKNIAAIPVLYADRYIKSPLLDDAYEATEFFPALGDTGKWLRFTTAAMKNFHGNIIGAIETLEDVTEQKHTAEALTSERERLASILDGIPLPTFVIDRNDIVVLWNSYNEIYTGFTKEQVVGKPVNLSFLFQDKISPSLAELILAMGDEELMAKFGGRGLLKSEVQPHTFESTGQIWIKGQERTVDIQAARIVDMKGDVVGVIQTAQDITERILLESQLRQVQKMQAIGTLAGGIAHDFNNILSAIMGYTDMALTEHKEKDHLRRYLEQVFKAGERARDLVKQILAFSRQSDDTLRPLRISPIIKGVLKLLRASLPSTIQIHQNIRSDPDTVLADPTHIHQLLMNLCTNAAHAMREGKGELKVTLSPVKIDAGNVLACHDLFPGMYLKLTVSDTGSGIDPVNIP